MTADLHERVFVGALMHLPAPTVIEVAAQVRQADLADPRLGTVYKAVVRVAAGGQTPDAALVDAHLRETGEVSATDRAAVVALLIDLYAEVPLPGAVASYARAVVEDAVRRRITEAATRLGQAAASSGLDTLAGVVATESTAIVEGITRLALPPVAVVA